MSDSNVFWKRMIQIYLDDMGYEGIVTEDEYDLMFEVYERAGGSWKGLAEGGTEDVSVLKKMCRAFKKRKAKT